MRMSDITAIRRAIPRDVFDYQELRDALSAYRKPRDKIGRLLAGGGIVRIKKGLYCFGDGLCRQPIERAYVANLIHGPSYVSLEYALSYHGLIPERVETVTSVTTRRSRTFSTPIGRFTYRTLTARRYAVGVEQEAAQDAHFLLATPEKALADKVWTDRHLKLRRPSDYRAYLLDDLRADPEALLRLDSERLAAIADRYDSRRVASLVRGIEQLRGDR